MSLELVLLVPVLVLLTVFVLWAGRGGQVALTADLAAEEAATAAALCCEEDSGGASGREALVEDVLEARPGLGFLCIGGPRPDAGGASGGFLSEHWLKFEPGRDTGGVGVLGVQFLCETDGAVAPLRGLFPTVTFHGQASEVVVREPRFIVGFKPTRVEVEEGDGAQLVFTVVVEPALGEEVTLTYEVVDSDTTAAPEDFEGTDFAALLGLDSLGRGTVMIDANADSAEIRLPVFDDDFFEGDEQLVLTLTGALPLEVQLDADRMSATGVIIDDDLQPHLFIAGPDPSQEVEGGRRISATTVTAGTLTFRVRLRDETNSSDAPSATVVSVDVRIEDITTTASDYEPMDPAASTWSDSRTRLTFDPGDVTIDVVVGILDDIVGEDVETFRLVLENNSAPLGSTAAAVGTIIDDEARVSVENVEVAEGDALTPGTLQFQVVLDRALNADLSLQYQLLDPAAGLLLDTAQRGTPPLCAAADDYLDLATTPGTLTITWPHDPLVAVDLPEVTICGDSVVEPDETLWLSMWVPSGGEAVMEHDGGAFGTILNDDIAVVSVSPAEAEGAEGQADPLAFTVSLTVGGRPAQLSEDITVDYAIGDFGTEPATAPGPPDADYTVTLGKAGTATPAELSGSTLQGTLTFTAGTSGTLPVTEHLFKAVLLADDLLENPETFQLDLDNLDPVGAAVFEDTDGVPSTDDSYAVGTITDDPPPVLSVTGFAGPEGSNRSFVVSLANARAGESVTVHYVIAGAGDDPAGAPGESTQPVDFEPVPDTDPFTGDLTDLLTGTLTLDESTPSVSVEVSLLGDAIREVPETLRLTLHTPTGAVLFDHDRLDDGVQAYGEGIINNVDSPWLSVNNTSAREGEPLTFTITLCNPILGEDAGVAYRTLGRSAAANRDFDLTWGTVGFGASTTVRTDSQVCGDGVDAKSQQRGVRTRNDSVEESDEEVHLEIYSPSRGVTVAKSIGVGRIINVSAATVRVSDPTADEGGPLDFVISLEDKDGNDAVTTAPVTVYYATADRTATAGDDYTPVPAAPGPCLTDTPPPRRCPFVTFAPNIPVDPNIPIDPNRPVEPSPDRTHSVEVMTRTDSVDEDDETVALVLRLAPGTDNAGLGDTEGTGTITDADPPALRIDDQTARESETMTFEVTLVDSRGRPTRTSEVVTVLAATEDGSAVEPGDYTGEEQRLRIPIGEMRAFFEVVTRQDGVSEGTETFTVVLSEAENALIDRAVGTGTIVDQCFAFNPNDPDAPAPTIIVQDLQVVEGTIIGPNVQFHLSAALCEAIEMTMTFVGRTATVGDIDPGGDYSDRGFRWTVNANLAARPGQLVGHWVYAPRDDDLDEDDEEVEVRVGWGRAEMQSQPPGIGTITIIDNDPEPSLRIADAAALEGTDLSFLVSLDAASGREVNVQYRTVQRSGADAATAVDDYVPVTDWRLITFAPGDTSVPVPVATAPDGVAEGDETMLVQLREPPDPSTPMNARLDDDEAVGTILAGGGPSLSISDAVAGEGETMRFPVELSEPVNQLVTVSYGTVERTGPVAAEEGDDGDYRHADGTLRFEANRTEAFINVTVNSDDVDEFDETFLVELSGQLPQDVSLADPSAVGTITGNVACVDHTVEGVVLPPMTVRPGSADEGADSVSFVLVLEQPLCASARVGSFASFEGTATRDLDFLDFRCQTIWVPGQTEGGPCRVRLVEDDLVEGDETIFAQAGYDLALPYIDYLIPDPRALVGTIIDNDEASVSVGDVSGAEGGFLNFVIRLGGRTERAVTVGYATEETTPPSAAAGADFRARSGTAVIAAGELSATVSVFAPQDRLDEDAETFLLRLSNPTGGASLADADATATGTITDDDEPPSLSVSDASVDEGGALVFAVTLDAPSGREVRIPRVTRDDTARAADGDYVALASGDVVFAPGVTRQTVRVRTLDDDVVESAEIVWLDLGPMDNNTATIDKGIGRGEIRDVSDRRVSVSDAFVVEGGALAFEVGFSEGPSGRDVTVRYRTRAGTAAAGDDYDDDYESASQELRIVAGETSAVVLVPTVPDTLDEDNESLELVLSDPQGAVIVAGAASGVIIDNDPLPALRVSDTEASEGVGASAVFTLGLSEESGRDVTVRYCVEDGTAKKDDDYIADVPCGEVVIGAGDRQVTVGVALVNDDEAEPVETFRLVVSGAVNASRDDSVGVATVTDDDGLVQVLVEDPAAVYEGEGVSAVFTVRLSRAHRTEAVTVAYLTADGTAAARDDYTAASGTLTFAAGDTYMTVSVPLVNDDEAELPETFRLLLAPPSSNAELGDGEASVLIRDDDGLPTVSVADASARTEGSAALFTVTLSRAAPQEVTVDYAAVVDPFAAAESAGVPGQDYTAVSGTVRFAARATEATVTVPLLDDSLDEHTETFWLRLSSPVGATILDGTATGTIVDDDPLPEISIGDAGATEGSPVRFEVRLDPVSGRTVTVPWATEALAPGVGAASPGADYTAAAGTLRLAPGTTTARFEVATLPDDLSEADERFQVHLGTPTNAALDDGAAIGAIRDDDGLPRIFIADTTVSEDAGPAIFTVTLSHPSSQPVTVAYTTADGTAASTGPNLDYAPDQVRTLTIPAAFTVGEISVFIADDDLSEGTETFTITLTDPVNAVIAEGVGTAVGTILDDDSEPRLTVEDAEECEDGSSTEDCDVRVCRDGIQDGGLTQDRHLECLTIVADPGVCQPGACAGDGTIDFVVRLSHASAEETSVRYTTFARDAADPRDYVASSGTLVIPAGDTSASIPVVLVDDAIPEQATEDFLLRLDNPDGVELEAAAAVGTIVDDERLPKVSDAPFDAYANEDDGFNYHRVTLSHPSDLTVTVDYSFTAVEDQNPFPGIDSTPGTLTFAPGVVEQTIAVPIYDNDVASVNPSQLPGSHNHLRSFGYANTHYRLRLRNRVNATSYGQVYTGLGVVWDDETPPYVDSVAAQDILEGAGAATLTITLNRFSDQAVTATYQTLDRTATAGSDFTATTGTVTFPPGTITANLTVPILDDDIVESDESFIFKVIRDPRNSNLTVLDSAFESGRGNNATRVWIIDDDVLPEISVSDVAANENAGTVTFWVSLSRASAQDVTVDYATADGTATAGSDYAAVDDMLIIRAGDTGAEVSVDIHDDDTTESDETFELALSGAAGATITDGDATVTIIEDEGLQTISIRDISESENRESTNPGLITPGPGRFMVFAPVLDDGTDTATRPMSVDWEVLEVPSLGDEAATVGSDIRVPDQSRTLVVPAGERVGLILFEIVGDLVPERDERFLVVLSNAVGAVLGDSRAWGTIFDNDLPIVSIADVEASESDDAVVFTLQLHEPGLDPASLRYTTRARPSEGDAAALPGDDYIQTTGTLQVAAGETTATISVPIIGDSADELDETFLLELSAPNGLELRDSAGVGTITDDDPGWVINDRGVREDAGSMVFTVNRDHTSTSAVTLNYTVTGASAAGGDSCTAGADYITPSGSVTLQPAETQAEISVTVCYDDIAEGSEILLIELTGVPGRKLTGTGTIVDND